MFAKGVERPAGTEADNFTHGRVEPKHGSISESMSDAINFAAFDAG